MKLCRLLFILSIFALAGCASTSPYKPAERGAYGYSDAALGENRHRVVFTQRKGDVAEAMDYALLRAAELALLEGRDWFIVRDRQTVLDREREPSVAIGASHERVVERQCGLLGCRTTSRPVPTAGHASIGTASGRSKVQAILEVELGSGEKPSNADVYTAAETRKTLRGRLGVNS